MLDQTHALYILRRLKAMGISVAMDDFGTGYSSLAMLHAFPFDKIKLDQSFVRRLPDDPSAAAIVRTVLRLGESLACPCWPKASKLRHNGDSCRGRAAPRDKATYLQNR